MSAGSKRLMEEWVYLLVVKASLDQQRTRVLAEIQGTIGDQT